MMNRKGQSLVLFVLLFPILLGIMALVIDVGNALVLKNHTDQVIEMSVDLVMDDKISINDMEQLLKMNLDGQDIKVVIDGDNIHVESSTYLDGIFSKLFDFHGFKIKSEYLGVVSKDNKTVLEKE